MALSRACTWYSLRLPIALGLLLVGREADGRAADGEDGEAPRGAVVAAEPPRFELSFASMPWRSIGPTTMGGRVTDLAVDPRRSSTLFVASASGGLFKTDNRGITFRAVFEHGGAGSIGAVAVAPSASSVVWIGTGEANPRNSVSWGDGVYKSTDGGATWTHQGLTQTRHVARIAIHPHNADVVFVAAMGRTWAGNPERGLYRTRDGGATWELVLFIDADTGCIDVRIDPAQPEVIYAAMWQRRRDAFDEGDPIVMTGAGSGLFRSTDGGESFERLVSGLPSRPLGRIGLDIYRQDPRVLFAVIQTDRTGQQQAPEPRSTDRASLGIRGKEAAGGFEIVGVTEGGPAALAGLQAGDVIRRVGDAPVEDARSLGVAMEGYRPGEEVMIAFEQQGRETSVRAELFGRRLGSGRPDLGAGMQGGQIANAQDIQGPAGVDTGGVFRSDDRGTTWQRINSLNPRPFYYSQIRVDPNDEQTLYVCGISFHRSSDGGRTFDTRAGVGVHPDHHALWIDPADSDHLLLGNDGGLYQTFDRCQAWDSIDLLPMAQFYGVACDMSVPYRVAGGLQDNGSWIGPSAVRASGGIKPTDWLDLNGGDGFQCAFDPTDPDIVYCESQNGGIVRVDLRSGTRRNVSKPTGDGQRYNWNTPILVSPHNPNTLLFAGTVVVQSIDEGRTHRVLSPNITRTEQGSATVLDQSPLDQDLLLVGTDDGALWLTRDGGTQWTAIHERLGLATPLYVSEVIASAHQAQRLFVTLDGHRQDDTAPYVFRSDDAGETFTRISAGLPDGPVRALVEDPRDEQLLFVGTEFGCFVSLDGGVSYVPFGAAMPTVPIGDLKIHPRDGELIAGTHGRGIYVVDITALRGLGKAWQAKTPHLGPLSPFVQLAGGFDSSDYGARRFRGANPAPGVAIHYALFEPAAERVVVRIKDALGQELRAIEGRREAGIHQVTWNLAGGGGGGGGFGRGGRSAGPGDYAVELEVDGQTQRTLLRVVGDPQLGESRTAGADDGTARGVQTAPRSR